MEDTKTITLKIVQRNYDVRVKTTDEDLFLRACNSIKESLQFYAQKSSHRDKQDLMAMVLLQAFVANLKQEEQLNNLFSDQDIQRAKDIDNLLNKVLNPDIAIEDEGETIETLNKLKEIEVADHSNKINEIDMYRKIDNEDKSEGLTLF